MLRLLIFCHIWFVISCTENTTAVIQFSVLENQHVCLQCGGSDRSNVVWTHQDREVLVTRQGSYVTNRDSERFFLKPDGGLCLLQLKESDGGNYRCNQQLVAELQVLTGHDFTVSAGRTLLLPCSGSLKLKKRWSQKREGGRCETILTRFRNGTVRAETSRLGFRDDALLIQDLQPEDAGEYLCNGMLQGRLTVLTAVQPELTSIQQTTGMTTAAVAMVTDDVDIKKKEKKRPENVLLLVAVVGLTLMIILLGAVCVLLTSMKCRRRKKNRCAAQREEDTELQPWRMSNTHTERDVYESPSLPEETLHYASLGRQNWRERPNRTPQDQNHHDVIYSSVITRPAGRQKHSAAFGSPLSVNRAVRL